MAKLLRGDLMLKMLKGKLSVKVKKVNRFVALTIAAAFIAITCCGFAYAAPNVVTITDTDGAPVQIKTNDTVVGKILSKQGIILNEGDRINYALTDEVGRDAVIEIRRAISVKIDYMGEVKECLTTENEVVKILAEQGIVVDDDDRVAPATYEKVKDGDSISVVLVDKHNITVQEEVDFSTKEIENLALGRGERVVLQEGKKGINEYVYEITYENGIEVSRSLIKDAILSYPIEEIVECGPEDVWELGVVPASAPTKYSRVEVFTATAYDASPADNGIWAGKTSTGMPLEYGVIAVDPKVIPYGTKMYIESVDGMYKYGYAIAGDCGGAIKGKKVDLFFPSRSTCYSFGRRAVKIYFLD